MKTDLQKVMIRWKPLPSMHEVLGLSPSTEKNKLLTKDQESNGKKKARNQGDIGFATSTIEVDEQ
jgi:hypothetical protein